MTWRPISEAPRDGTEFFMTNLKSLPLEYDVVRFMPEEQEYSVHSGYDRLPDKFWGRKYSAQFCEYVFTPITPPKQEAHP